MKRWSVRRKVVVFGMLAWLVVGAFVGHWQAVGAWFLMMLYFLPVWVALFRHKPAGGVAVIDFFLGWTVIGWIIALAMASG